MNYWAKLSIEYANQRNYLDDLFSVYPTIPNGIRDVDKNIWEEIEKSFKKQDNLKLVESVLKLKLFPIKDSYVAYLKRDKTAIKRNPKTIDRLSGRLYEMGLDEIFERATEPKETNRQIGPLFGRWINKGSLGIKPVPLKKFISSDENAILDAKDNEMMNFAKEHLKYKHKKGLDLVARFNGKYVIGEAKFLTDFGGHQNAQFNDAISTAKTKVDAITVAILDGVLYIPSKNKMHKSIIKDYKNQNIMSALVLREFLYQI
ncbi:restriction endonuclease [Candidatus Gracilibacteria bacterium]|nr:restriction endonuclease [Candidatus Gracilibacteria bacterium]MCF7856538.1 restriction endonuclease [Candidatus Gracilibacteria bacterium]MCF7896861.1 restriction endonuclease [Candidatus Gracilibacteria bacterium]